MGEPEQAEEAPERTATEDYSDAAAQARAMGFDAIARGFDRLAGDHQE